LQLSPVQTLSATALTLGGVLFLGAVLASRIYDLGFDSQSYHQRAVVDLASGWNPILEPVRVRGVYAPFVAHYSTGTWVQAALVFLLSRDIEAAKLVNVIALAASFCLSRGALEYTGLVRPRFALFAALAAALNPVTVVQAMTFYVDGYLASMVVGAAATLLLVVAEPRRLFFGAFGMVLLLLTNAKFTGVVFALPLSAAAAILLIRRQAGWKTVARFVAVQALACGVALGFVGFHPYVTNTVAHGHPFYPLRGPVVAHTIDGLRPMELARHEGRLERLVRSVFADPARPWRNSGAIYKLPFTVTEAEFEVYATPDARVGGWGPLFSAVAVAAACGLVVALVLGRRDRVPLLVATGSLAVSALMNSECWWARLAPQIALIPVVVAIALGRCGAPRPGERFASPGPISRASGQFLIALLLGNAAIVIASQALYVPRKSAELERFLSDLGRESALVYVADRWVAPLRRLQEYDVPFVAVLDDGDEPDPELGSRLPCGPLRVFPGTMNEIRYCAVIEAPLAVREEPNLSRRPVLRIER
jgi:hypothetical protein